MLLREGRNARVPPLFLLFIDWNSAIAVPVAAFAGQALTRHQLFHRYWVGFSV